MSADERYLVANRGRVAEVGVADLVNRTAWALPVSSDLPIVGGVALNRASTHSDLLAVHGYDKVAVYQFAPNGPLVELGRVAVEPPKKLGAHGGPHLSLAWSGRGDHIIAATDVLKSEFAVLSVADGGRRIEHSTYLTACLNIPHGSNNLPNDILTANELLPAVPVPTPTATDTRVGVETPTPSNSVPNACDFILNRVPAVAINWALANPNRVRGWNELAHPGLPPSPFNGRRRWLSLQNVSVPYHPLYNGLVYKAGCP